VESALCTLITIFLVVLFVRVVVSWFPMPPGSFTAQLYDVMKLLTDWAVLPLRAVIPPVGMLDISVMILGFALIILQRAICG
jgi:uncharacterized protein YggT (Ycf19 family)